MAFERFWTGVQYTIYCDYEGGEQSDLVNSIDNGKGAEGAKKYFRSLGWKISREYSMCEEHKKCRFGIRVE